MSCDAVTTCLLDARSALLSREAVKEFDAGPLA